MFTFWPAPGRAQAPQFVISTVAGNNTVGFSGDGGPATSAQLSNPGQIAVDKSGNLYIADQDNNRIRKVSGGVISTIAGNGTSGYAGDGGASTNANISYPYGIAVDPSGNVYFSQPFPATDSAIREAPASGNMSSITSTNTNPGFGFSNDGLAATTAQVFSPTGLALDSAGNLYFADSGNNRIRIINKPGSGNINTIAGNGFAQYTDGGGIAFRASLNNPQAVAVDSAGNVYIADTNNHCIRKVSGAAISVVAGVCTSAGFSGDNGPAVKALLNYPKGVAVDSAGNIYIADTYNFRIRMVTTDGIIHTIAGRLAGYGGDGGLATTAKLSFPQSIAVVPDGSLYVSDTQNNVIRLLTPASSTGPAANPPAITSVFSASAYGNYSATAAPGSWIEIHGTSLASTTRQWTSSDFSGNNAPTSLDGTSVQIAGQNAVVLYISQTQVNAQVPLTVTPGPQTVTVTTADGHSLPFAITVNAAQPGLCQGFSYNGSGYAAAVIANTDPVSYALPAAANFGISSRPVHPGEIILLFGNGFGSVTPAAPQGQLVQQTNQLTMPLQIFFGSVQATVQYMGLAPGFVGLYQFNVVVPDIPDSDSVPITFALGNFAGAPTLYTAVKH